MGIFSGWQSTVQSAAQTIANLVGQDIVARSFSASQASGSDAFKATVNGARWHFGAGATDYASSDGNTVTFASNIAASNVWGKGGFANGASGATFISQTAPTIAAGAGAAIVASNGTVAFEINLGGAAQTGTITLPSATTGWVVYMQNITTPASFVISQTGFTQTTATFTCYSRTTGLAINWTANDHMVCLAMAY